MPEPEGSNSSKRIVFVSDTHLTPSEEARTDRFSKFLDSLKGNTEVLFILGDLFEYWVGPDHAALPDHQSALVKLRELATSGTTIRFLWGNRDFHLDARSARVTGIRVQGDFYTTSFGGRRALLTHGDLLTNRDVVYKAFRAIIRHRVFREFFTKLPLWFRLFLARRARKASAEGKANAAEDMNLDMDAIRQVFKAGFDLLICGHCHKAGKTDVITKSKERTLYTLGDWSQTGSYLEFSDGIFTLKTADGI